MKSTLFRSVFVGLLLSALTSSGQVQHHIAAANINVVQNDTSNNTASVTVTASLSINDFRIRTGSNRADYDVQIGANSTDDVTNGILMGCIDQNGRDNGEPNFPGMNYGTCSIDSNASGSPGSSGEYWLAVFQAPQNAEYNFNVAAAWFPYSDGWYGGWLVNAGGNNGGANNHLIGNPNLVLGTHVVDQGSGKTKVDLRPFGLDSRTNAVLLVEGGKNEANFALSSTNGDGTWTITCRDDNGGAEQDYVGFVCVPMTNHTVISGKFLGNKAILLKSQTFTVSNPGLGTYHLSIPGVDPDSGVLIISAEGGGSLNPDNIVSYQVNGDGWDIQTRDITTDFTPALQQLDSSNAVVSFVFIPAPPPTTLRWGGVPTTAWDFSPNTNWRLTNNTPTNYFDGAAVVLDDSGSNFVVNLAASVSPSQVVVSNILHDYSLVGSGGIFGTGGFTKTGSGKLTLGAVNQYTGPTLISQGTVTLAAMEPIPAGPDFGNVTVNGTLDLNGFNCALNNLSGTGTIDNAGSGGSPRLTIYQTINTGFSGTIKNSTGSLGLLLDGGGMLTLSGNSTFSGGCTVSNGTLTVNGSSGSSPVLVESNGQLSGIGVVSGSVTMADHSALSLRANAALITGPMTLNGTVEVNVNGGVSLTSAGTYLLLRHGALSGPGSFKLMPPPGLQPNGFAAHLVDSGTQLQLVVTASGVTGTIADVRHVVMFMNENRSFDHYFGTLHGVHGFNDRNALQLTNGLSDFYQPSGSSYELPFQTGLQCLTDLNHSWPVTHSTVNNGWNNTWIANKGAETMCYHDRSDIPYYYALADAFTICDDYHCGVLSSTDPNRITWLTGMIDPNSTGGGPEIDNTSLPSGFTWKTYAECLQDAGVTWKVYQITGNNGENVLNMFANFKQASPGNPLYDRGRVGSASLAAMINAFATDVANNTLPAVSWIIGPGDHSEHPPNSSASGEYIVKQLTDALASNPQVYKSSVFMFNYDENDGFFDHARPVLPPPGTADEFVGTMPVGLGIRVPAIIISPWTRGGRVCSQTFDHTSEIRFLETWTGVMNPNISAWRRQVCGDLTSAFDFAHPDTNYPNLAGVSEISCPSGTTAPVPSPQVYPAVESGTLSPMPLPYQPNAICLLSTASNTFTVVLTNFGAASVHFGLYANAYRTDGPWQFDVDTTNSAAMSFSTAGTGGNYDFTAYGPNGFQRRFKGNLAADFQKVEANSILNPVNGGLQVELDNPSAILTTFTVTNGYSLTSASYIVAGHATNVINVGSETNNGFYDITVTASSDSAFLRRFLGRVEKYVPPTLTGSQLLPNGTFQISFTGPAGQPYSILAATNLVPPITWVKIGSGTIGTDPAAFAETNLLNRAARFYRVVSP